MGRTQITFEETDHPLEDILDIEPGTTIVPKVEHVPTILTPMEEYDAKDNEIESQFQEVYDAAMTAFETASDSVAQIEPKYRARNEEVAVQYLNTALSAARDKAHVKQHKDKVHNNKVKASGHKTVNNKHIVGNRNEILKTLMDLKDVTPVTSDALPPETEQ